MTCVYLSFCRSSGSIRIRNWSNAGLGILNLVKKGGKDAPCFQKFVVADKEALVSSNGVQNQHSVRFGKSDTSVAMLVCQIKLSGNSLVGQTGLLGND